MSLDFAWLPEHSGWKEALQKARQELPETAFCSFQRLANSRMDFVRAGQLDKVIHRYLDQSGPPQSFSKVRLALLGTGTLTHLLPGIRLGALRRGILADIYVAPYGMYRQELGDPTSGLHQFQPEVICFSFDAEHLAPAGVSSPDQTISNLEYCWLTAQNVLGCVVIQQTALARFPALMGNNEDRLETSQASVLRQINEYIRNGARTRNLYLLSIDSWSGIDGIASWFDPSLWYSAKQEIHLRASMFYGDLLGRLLGALRGKSAKCLVLDLDNTLWGGAIGDDGLEGIALGQGSSLGEAFIAFQLYAQQLAQRGILLAVCSKNDHENAIAPFDTHPEMILRRSDIACFVANWQDKATNLRHIAQTLNIGLDSLVFVDDNPAERRLIRIELPMVAVPELPEDPAGYVACLANAGFFEAVDLTPEDAERTALYRANARREASRQTATDLSSYLDGLQMNLLWSPFDGAGLKRIVQLINKTNQFNLTTHRYTEADVTAILRDPSALTMQLRLTDIHGDNGMIGVIIGYHKEDGSLLIDTWLMSCRVLGRGVEQAALNLLCTQAQELGCIALHGVFHPSSKNAMVRDHYRQLGFDLTHSSEDGVTHWVLPLERFLNIATHMGVQKAEYAA